VTAIHDMAFAANAAGLSVVPPREDGSKAPLGTWTHYQHFRATAEQLHKWYGPHTGLGAVLGKVSRNTEAFEFDDREVYERFLALARQSGLGDLVEKLETGYVEDTPSGGVHWLMRCETIAGNTKLATRPKRPEEQRDPKDSIKTLIETRGEGGFIVLAPSNGTVHPSGRAYRLRAGGFTTIPTLTPDERRALHQLARTPRPRPSAWPFSNRGEWNPNSGPGRKGRPLASRASAHERKP
jgi:putative DNA primase/helicase